MLKESLIALHQPALCLGLALFSSSVVACASECTLIACSPHAEIEFKLPIDLSDGDKLVVTLDQETKVDCTASESTFKCSDARVTWLFRGKETTTGSGTTQNAGGDPVGISVQGTPKTVALQLFKDGTAAGGTETKPKYLDSEINGPGCGTCDIATESVTLAQP
jgi:hypothetical protein